MRKRDDIMVQRQPFEEPNVFRKSLSNLTARGGRAAKDQPERKGSVSLFEVKKM